MGSLDSARFRAKNKAAGLCVCGKSPVPGKKSCARCVEKAKKYNKDNYSRLLKIRTGNDRQVRSSVLAQYGGRCVCCGETEPVFLTIDHVNNDGAKHRKQVRSREFLAWLRREGFPSGFQILCWNCNWAKYNLGVCPHAAKTHLSVVS